MLITQNKNKLSTATYITLTIDKGKVVSKRAEYFDLKNYPSRNIVVSQMVNAFKHNPAFSRVLAVADAPFDNIHELGAMVCDAFMAGTGAEVTVGTASSYASPDRFASISTRLPWPKSWRNRSWKR